MEENTWDIAHLGHVEMLTPRLEQSTRFFTEIMGMYISDTQGDSVYLRAYDDYEHHSLKLTAHKHAGIAHYAWRVRSAAILEKKALEIQNTAYGIGWSEGDLGHGRSYRFHMPSGHLTEIYFETEKYQANAETASALKNTASKFPARGVNARRIDHLNLLAANVREFQDFQLTYLGGRVTETILFENQEILGAWFSVNSKSYDLAVTQDHVKGMRNRLHHVTYALNSREEVLIAADIALENGIHIETGPHKHAIQQTFFLYLYEPGGNRVEVANTTARLVLDPDYKTIVWTKEERSKGQAWGLETVKSFHTHGTPRAEDLD